MGKKQTKNQQPNPSNLINKDIIQRLNFLYQSSVYLSSLNCGSSSTSKRPKAGKKGARKFTARDPSRSYIDTMKVVGRKTTVKIDPSVKRTLCQGCNLVLVPGTTAFFRAKRVPSHGHVLAYTCQECLTTRRIPAPPVPTQTDLTEMVVEDPEPDKSANVEQSSSSRRDRRKKRLRLRQPPLFSRGDAGHEVSELGNGLSLA
ncbi:RNAse P Rpr2/Rpp21/SNM1 subunit domain-containing protein [Flagelloscypha sp. PMI_526]|nr:RNAse P Rpr2/Rpp21/SNM1 subunit domain-containing protein [Flagelloscypha sp. PMI_526]